MFFGEYCGYGVARYVWTASTMPQVLMKAPLIRLVRPTSRRVRFASSWLAKLLKVMVAVEYNKVWAIKKATPFFLLLFLNWPTPKGR